MAPGHSPRDKDSARRSTAGTTPQAPERRRWEDALLATEQRFRGVFQHAPIGIAITDVAGRFEQCNPAYCELLGYSEEELRRSEFPGLIHPEDRASNLASSQALLSGRIPSFEVENRYIRKDGTSLWVHKFVSVLRDRDGTASHMIALITDMSERRRSEEAVRASEARARTALEELEATYERAPIGLCVLDRELRYVRINARLAEMHGLPPQAHIGKTFREVVPALADAAEAIASGIFETGKPARDIEIVGETAAEPGHERVWCENWFPLFRNDEVVGINIVVEEITARREARRSFEQQSKLLRTITDTATTSIFMTDITARLTFMNPAAEAMTGYTMAEAQGRVLHDLIHNTRADGTPYPNQECPIDRARPERVEVHDQEEFFVRKDGTFFEALCNARPVWSDDPTLGTVIEVRDISRQKMLERERQQALDALKDADRRKDEFLAMLAHELRSPLAPVRNASTMLRLLSGDDARIKAAHDIIERQVSHMTRLIDDLLDVSRITRGTIVLQKERLSLAEVVEAAVETAKPGILKHEHTLAVTLEDGLFVDGDRARLVQVVTNLLANAVKFTPRGGRIRVSTSRAASNAVLCVADSGIGIPEEARHRIFDLFQQEDASLARTPGGLGIGLTIVKRLVEMHGGSVEIRSKGSGEGCDVRVTLPAVTKELEESRESTVSPATTTASPSLRIVLVEDNPDAAESFQMLLELHGHVVVLARDGFEGIRRIAEFHPDVAFVDLGLPGIDGFGVAGSVRSQIGRQPVLIALSGYGREEDKQRSHEAGFDGHMTKPVEYERVEQLLKALSRRLSEVVELR